MRHLLRARWTHLSAGAALGIGALLLGPGQAVAAAPSGWKVVEASETRLRLTVDIPEPRLRSFDEAGQTWAVVELDEYAQRGEPGWPLLPSASAWLCLPPQATVRMSARVLQTQLLPAARIAPVPTPYRDPAAPFGQPSLIERRLEGDAYATFRVDRDGAAELSEPTFTRKQRLAAITVRPVLYDAASGTIEVVRRLEVDVVFEPAIKSAAAADPTLAFDAAVGGAPDVIVQSTLLNPGFAAQWKCLSPEQGARASTYRGTGASMAPPPAQTQSQSPSQSQSQARATGDIRPLDPGALLGPEFRLRVTASRPARLVMGDLFAEGFPQDVPRRKVRLYQRRWNDPTDGLFDAEAPLPLTADVPLTFLGNPDPNGLVTAADEIYFLAQDVRDDEAARTINGQTFPRAVAERADNWNGANVYWIAAVEPDVDGWARMAVETLGAAAGAVRTSFPRQDRLESDTVYQDNPDDDANLPRHHWTSHTASPAQASVELFHPTPGGDVTITYTLAARVTSPAAPSVTTALVKGTTSQIVGAHTVGNLRLTTFSGIAPVDPFGDGFATFQIQGGNPVLVYLGSITLDYQAGYAATRDEARFNTGVVGGSVSLRVPGFSQNDPLVFDVTDARAPRAIAVMAANFPTAGTLSLEVPQGAGERRAFWALRATRADRIRADDIDPVAAPAVTADAATFPEGQAQVLVIGPASLAAAMQPWMQWRRDHDREGWRFAYVDVQAAYDQFSGGLKSPTAIKRLIEFAYLTWDAKAVVLVGSASEDARGIAPGAGPDLVPCPLHVQLVSGQKEVLGSDKWFVTFGTNAGYPGSNTHGPDMAIGRLPARNAGELGTMLAKIFAYEQPQATDTWRQRLLWVSDDAWSSDTIGLGGTQYCYRTSEEAFRLSQARSSGWSDSLDTAIQPSEFHLSTYTDPMHPDRNCMDVGQIGTYQSRVGTEVWPQLLARMNQGALVVSYQGHAAYNVLGHEYLMTGQNVPGLGNGGRPFLFFGMGCHVSDFLDFRETSNGVSIGQQLLLLPNAGAIATYGSNGYEFLTQITVMMESISKAMLTVGRLNSPVIGDTLRNQWTLAEVMGQGEHDIFPAGITEREMVAQFHVLGDPLLRLDAAPPRLSLLHEGTPLTEGATIVLPAAASTYAVELRGVDETGVARLLLSDSRGQDYSASLVPVATGDPRRRTATLDLPVVPYGGLLDALEPEGPRGYRVQAQAYDGAYPDVRPTTLSVIVPFTLEVRVNGAEVAEGSGPLSPAADASMEIEFESPLAVPQDQIAVAIDAAVIASAPTIVSLDAEGRRWRVSFAARGDGSGDPQVLHLTLSGVTTDFAMTQTAEEGQLGIAQHYPFPSPADPEQGPVWFVAQTTAPARFARVTIYDLSGRPVARADSGVGSPENEVAVRWDGRDDQGDSIANGVYMYRLEVGDGAALVRSSMGRVVLMR